MAKANVAVAQSHVLQCSSRPGLAAMLAVYIAAIIIVAALPSRTAATDESLTTLQPDTFPHDHASATEATPMKKNSKLDPSGDHQAQDKPTHATTHHPHKGSGDHTATSHLPTHPTTAAHQLYPPVKNGNPAKNNAEAPDTAKEEEQEGKQEDEVVRAKSDPILNPDGAKQLLAALAKVRKGPEVLNQRRAAKAAYKLDRMKLLDVFCGRTSFQGFAKGYESDGKKLVQKYVKAIRKLLKEEGTKLFPAGQREKTFKSTPTQSQMYDEAMDIALGWCKKWFWNKMHFTWLDVQKVFRKQGVSGPLKPYAKSG